jgi:hypothetical protein
MYYLQWKDETSLREFELSGTLDECIAGFHSLRKLPTTTMAHVYNPQSKGTVRGLYYERGTTLNLAYPRLEA